MSITRVREELRLALRSLRVPSVLDLGSNHRGSIGTLSVGVAQLSPPQGCKWKTSDRYDWLD